MAPGQETRLGRWMRIAVKPVGMMVHFCKKVLDVHYCHKNSPPRIARAMALVSAPLCVVCGIVAFCFGPWHVAQGAVAITAGSTMVVIERPMFPRLCIAIRKKEIVRAWIYAVLSLPLFLSWYTLVAGLSTMIVALMHAFSSYLPEKQQQQATPTKEEDADEEEEEDVDVDYDDEVDEEENEETTGTDGSGIERQEDSDVISFNDAEEYEDEKGHSEIV